MTTPGLTTSATAAHVFHREGEYWTIHCGPDVVRLKDCAGLQYIAYLLQRPNRDIWAVDLVAIGGRPQPTTVLRGDTETSGLRISDLGDAGRTLDDRAKRLYRRRLQELEQDLEEATTRNDQGRAGRTREELEWLHHELRRAVGIGGRDRVCASHVERARVNVTRAIKAVLRKLTTYSRTSGWCLATTIKTGRFCVYVPDPRFPVAWDVSSRGQ